MPAGMDFSQVTQLSRDLRKMPLATRKQLRRKFEQAGQGALSDAKSRASWSHRIPAAISGKGTATADKVGYELRASSAQAPHARPYEGMGGGGTFRHPVYGNRENWVSQATRPYLYPAVRGRMGAITAAIADAAEQAARECGFR